MVSDSIAKVHSVKGESEAKSLPDKVERLSSVGALFAVAVGCVRVASRGDDLETEGRDACRTLASNVIE